MLNSKNDGWGGEREATVESKLQRVGVNLC